MKRDGKAKVAIVACLSILALCPAAVPRIIHVDDDGPADFNTIQAAIDDANNGDAVIVHPGTYTGPGNRDIRFKGKAITLRSVDPNDPNIVAATVVDCEGTEKDYHCGFHFYGEGPGSILGGLSIINGYATHGGAVFCEEHASPTVLNCCLISNHAMRGGGIYIGRGSPCIRNCVIMGNSVSSPSSTTYRGEGGGIYCSGDTLVTISGCLVAGNCASGSRLDPGAGGGIFLSNNRVSIRHCTVVGNTADVAGGLFCNEFATITIAGCIVRSNTAPTSAQISGAPSVTYSDVEGGWAGLGNIDLDPLFTNSASGDYHLAAGSPCIDAGDPQYVPYVGQTDCDDEPRVMGARVDIGADEFTCTPTAVLNAYPKQLLFHADANAPGPEGQILHIENAGFAPLTWDVAEDSQWLVVNEAPAGTQGVSLGVDVAGLGPGRHDCEVTVIADDVPNSPQTIAVSLYVRAGKYLHVPQPYTTIQSAVESSQDGDIVIIAEGTYTGPGNRDIDFLGKSITVRSSDPNDPAAVGATIIDCGGTDTESHRGFVFHSGEDANSVLSGLTITHGRAPSGAGVFIAGSSPTLLHCNIIGNTLGSSDSRDKYSSKFGGGVYAAIGNPHILHCVISNNGYDGYSNGGGIYCSDANLVISDCWIESNQVHNWGAGIACHYGGSIVASRCVIRQNRTTFRSGGGICLRSAKGVFNNCLIAENRSEASGAGIYLDYSETVIRNCTAAGNIAASEGGGVYFSIGELTITNTIFWGNRAPKGSQVTLYTWLGYSPGRGLPPDYKPEINATVDIAHCDIQGGRPAVYIFNDPVYLQLNWGTDNIDADPLFADAGRGDYHLKSQAGRWEPVGGRWVIDDVTSPCIDAGDPNSPVGDEPEPNGGRINMGAYGGTTEASKSYSGG